MFLKIIISMLSLSEYATDYITLENVCQVIFSKNEQNRSFLQVDELKLALSKEHEKIAYFFAKNLAKHILIWYNFSNFCDMVFYWHNLSHYHSKGYHHYG